MGGLCACKCHWCCSPKGTRSFFLWIKGQRHTSYDVTFQPVFWLLAKQNPIIASQVANHLRKKKCVSALYHLSLSKKKFAASKHTNYVMSGLFFFPSCSISPATTSVSLSATKTSSGVCSHNPMWHGQSRGRNWRAQRKKQRIATRQGEEGGTKAGKR